MKILVAEDDRVSLTAVSQVLRKAGYQIVTVADGLEALRCLQRPDAPQIAVIDWMMPGMDGPEICRRLRAQRPRPVVYLVLLTGRSDQQDVIHALKAGADDFLRKPFNPSELKARLEVGQRVVRLYNDQQLNIDQARKLLTIANSGMPSWIGINDELTLHLSLHSTSSQRASGDHCWARTFANREAPAPITLLALRDQSGHEVNCILRSIATDMFHKEAVDQSSTLEDQLVQLNDRLCASGMFAEDDFLTGLTLELDHGTLLLRYVSCGHPPMFLIRGTKVTVLPSENGPGQNLPLGSLAGAKFEAGQHQLLPGDRLVLFTDGLLELNKSARGAARSIAEIGEIIEDLVKQTPAISIQKLLPKLLDHASGPLVGGEPVDAPDDVTVLGLELEPDAGPNELVLRPGGHLELDHAIQQIHQRLLSEWGIEPNSPQRIRSFLDEALTNAWVHGNRQNPGLPIYLRWGHHNAYSIVVEDAGNGFDPARLPDPRSPAGLRKESGRGVYLIRSSCAWAEWKKGGRRLVARFAPIKTP